jgi:broad specificity phosphatase PhoE
MEIALTELGHAQARAASLRAARAPDLLVVSPMRRAAQTAAAFESRWPGVPRQVWPISEFTYLSPSRCVGTTAADRRAWVDAYWARCDPGHVDGEGAESFAAFMGRVSAFHERITALGSSFVVAVGHGQFFRAYTLGFEHGFAATDQAMRDFRAAETADPLANGAVVEIPFAISTRPPGISAHTGE